MTGRIRALGVARVISVCTITTWWPGRTSSRSAGEPIGLRSACRSASASSGTPGTYCGWKTSAESGMSMVNPCRP